MTLDENSTVVAIKALRLLKGILDDVNKIATSKEYIAAFQIAQLHGFPYAGEQFNKALFDQAKELIEEHAEYLEPEV